ncbi:hypothetical protein NQ318_019979 [Aromia moschata]|uniref:GP-PDE domain-containing protein n=1 Tax=Aromia moschata TaxID=1265417 RepID=A0AAV8Y678_9CUCU|nr:hypothetical protein NQ318_019979 [Aromia moschata]
MDLFVGQQDPPDLSPLDCFLWGFLKEIVYRQPIEHNIDLLKTRIIQAVMQLYWVPTWLLFVIEGRIKDARLFLAILTIFYFFRGCSLLINDIFFNAIPYSVVLIVVILLGIYLVRIPPPDYKQLEHAASEFMVKSVAHRGGGWDAPENSLIAFELSKEKGYDVIEFDVTLTGDGVPIVFHDTTLHRMAGIDLVVQDTTWEELSKVDISVAHRYKENFTGTTIPTLDEAVTQMLACDQKMIIDIKDNDPKMVTVILNLYKKYSLHSKSIVSSFYPNIIYRIRRADPKIVCSLAWKKDEFSYEICEHDGCRGKRRANVWYKHCFLVLCDFIHAWALPRITYYVLGVSLILLHKESLSGL